MDDKPRWKIAIENPKTGRVDAWFSWESGKYTAISRCIQRTEEKTPIGELPSAGTWNIKVEAQPAP